MSEHASPSGDGAYFKQNFDWRESAYIPVARASNIAGVSVSQIYRLQKEGRLEFRKLAGRTLVTTESLIDMLENAEPWTPSDRGAQGRAAWVERSRSAWAE